MSGPVYGSVYGSVTSTGVGTLEHRSLDLDRDLALVHRWVTHPRSAFWMMQGATVEQVRAEYAAIVASAHHHAFLGHHDGEPVFLFELYDPAHDAVAEHLDVRAGDLGMHVLVSPPAEPGRPVHGLTRAVLRHVMDACFADAAVHRVVVEPDVANSAVRALNREVGFSEHRPVALPGKQGVLSTCTRNAYQSHEPHQSREPHEGVTR